MDKKEEMGIVYLSEGTPVTGAVWTTYTGADMKFYYISEESRLISIAELQSVDFSCAGEGRRFTAELIYFPPKESDIEEMKRLVAREKFDILMRFINEYGFVSEQMIKGLKIDGYKFKVGVDDQILYFYVYGSYEEACWPRELTRINTGKGK